MADHAIGRSTVARPGAAAATQRRRSDRRLATLAVILIVGLGAGYLATPDAAATQAAAEAGAELTRLLRAMALLKLAFVLGAAALAGWRLRHPVRPGLAAGYIACLGGMALGPGLIWSMAHVVLGAVLLHGSLLAFAVLFLRDEGSPAMLRFGGGR